MVRVGWKHRLVLEINHLKKKKAVYVEVVMKWFAAIVQVLVVQVRLQGVFLAMPPFIDLNEPCTKNVTKGKAANTI